MQDRVIELEIKLAHTEQSLNELSDVLYRQQQLIERLELRIDNLQQRLDAGASVQAGGDAGDEKPPHY